MKRLSIIFLFAAVCLAVAGCSDTTGGTEGKISLTTDIMEMSLAYPFYHNTIGGGSGTYSATIDNQQIADVSVVTYESEPTLRVDAKAAGETAITVTDSETGKYVVCSLKVNTATMGLVIDDVRYGVDADDAEVAAEIETDMAGNEPYPAGSRFYMTYTAPEAGDWKTATEGVVHMPVGGFTRSTAQFKPSYNLIETSQIITGHRINIYISDHDIVYDMYIIRGRFTERSGISMTHVRFYEDRTEHYRAMYPDAGVNGAVRVYLSGTAADY